MKSIITGVAVACLALPAIAAAHVSVRPRESKPSAHVVTNPTVTPTTEKPSAAAGHVGHAQTGATQAPPTTGEAAKIEAWLKSYDEAFNAKDLEKLGSFYHAQVTIYEGGGIDNGWASYRDGHLGPELKAFENLQFGHSNRQIHMVGDRAAYVVSTYSLKAQMGERMVDSGGLETLVVIKGDDGAWKIRHSHTSSRPRRPAGGGN